MVLVAAMMVLGALPSLAEESAIDRASDHRVSIENSDRRADVRPVDPVPVGVVDRPVDRVRDRMVDRVRDRETDRYRCVDVETDRRCIDDRHPHLNIRHLIQRLINAGEWEKLFRLLHRLGII